VVNKRRYIKSWISDAERLRGLEVGRRKRIKDTLVKNLVKIYTYVSFNKKHVNAINNAN